MSQNKPNLIFGKPIWIIILVIWVIIWMGVFFKNLFFKGYLKTYVELVKRHGVEAKRSYVMGDYLYELVTFCKTYMPESATFNYNGIKQESIEDRRFRYYLYPRLFSESPEYRIVCDIGKKTQNREWVLFKQLDESRYILRRVE